MHVVVKESKHCRTLSCIDKTSPNYKPKTSSARHEAMRQNLFSQSNPPSQQDTPRVKFKSKLLDVHYVENWKAFNVLEDAEEQRLIQAQCYCALI